LVKKAEPVTKLMIKDVLDSVDAVQMPPMQLTDGPWLQAVLIGCVAAGGVHAVAGAVWAACR